MIVSLTRIWGEMMMNHGRKDLSARHLEALFLQKRTERNTDKNSETLFKGPLASAGPIKTLHTFLTQTLTLTTYNVDYAIV